MILYPMSTMIREVLSPGLARERRPHPAGRAEGCGGADIQKKRNFLAVFHEIN